ncbi:MAG: hypothetical protein JWN03_213 [Nocardia sp.]|uniref:M48 family metalloprotease n=1 Tax=Nocardia sp. TaxID=1821 RepID=UPI00263532EE|nr:M48 family metalloprotease [Nocardia sp.]MCU1639938.1 hypothetical protein [Nocardia sp.]
MRTDQPAGSSSKYRFTGGARVLRALLPPAQLLVDLPWAAATIAIIRSCYLWAGLWLSITLLSVSLLPWLLTQFTSLTRLDEDARRRRAAGSSGRVRYPHTRAVAAAVLTAVWKDVSRAAGIPASRYRLTLIDSPLVNAYAYPRRLIAVTEAAVRQLTSRELRGVVAHELGHELIGGWGYRALRSLCIGPMGTVFYMSILPLLDFINSGYRSFPPLGLRTAWTALVRTILLLCPVSAGVVALVAAMTPALGTSAAIGLAAACAVQPLARMWLAWREEYLADRVAADLGYGAGLASHLSNSAKFLDPLILTHPPFAARIRKILVRTNELRYYPRPA